MQEENISVKIYDAFGKKIADVLSEEQTQKPGSTLLTINSEKLPEGGGVYFITMKGKSFCRNIF